MLPFFRSLLDRLKSLLLVDAALDLEAGLLSRQAHRQAELLKQAD